jgi:hypothetical protein
MKVDELRRPPETVLEHIADGANVVVGVTNGEPVRILEPIGAMKGDEGPFSAKAYRTPPSRTFAESSPAP